MHNDTTFKHAAESAARLIPLTRWSEFHEWPPLGGLRHLVFHARRNGFDKVIRRVGRRVLLDEQAFFEWVEEQNSRDAGGGRV